MNGTNAMSFEKSTINITRKIPNWLYDDLGQLTLNYNPAKPKIFILVLDGVDSSGKTTLAKAMVEFAEAHPQLFNDIEVRHVKFPRSNSQKLTGMDYLADFKAFYDEHARVKQDKPILYICDRYWPSTIVYNGGWNQIKDFIDSGKYFPVVNWAWCTTNYNTFKELDKKKKCVNRDNLSVLQFDRINARFSKLFDMVSELQCDYTEPFVFPKIYLEEIDGNLWWSMDTDKLVGTRKHFPNAEAVARMLLMNAKDCVRALLAGEVSNIKKSIKLAYSTSKEVL